MRGYKGFEIDLKCRGMQYEVGKSYHQDGKIITCKNGLHFCKNLGDTFLFYDIDGGSRYCEVEAFGEIDFTRVNKFAASDIRVIRELSRIEVNRGWYDWYGHDIIYGGYNDGYGYGDGCGYGCGTGNGFSDGAGYGQNDGNGCGDGLCYGYGDGYGDGHGYGEGGIQNILIFREV